jgi:hypothetical protein
VAAARALILLKKPYSFSNPWFVNFRVRQFSVTVRTTLSEKDADSGHSPIPGLTVIVNCLTII